MKREQIAVASGNNVKFRAVSGIFMERLGVMAHRFEQVRVKTGVSEQPKSLDEIATGAQTRARNAFGAGKYFLAVGIENGIFPVESCSSGYLERAECAIYDGERFYTGHSSAFEVPRKIVRLILEKGYDMNQAVLELGLTDKQKLGREEGIIGVLTNGRIDRTKQAMQAVEMALVPYLHRELYFG
ncbi:MAG: DUF84 family protein [archaeon]|jgi:inosine/xanthosine triphosphatase|nr:DUF84 family protein [archaeon]